MYWYIIFVRAGREERVEQLLKELLNTDLFTPFIPLHEILFKKSGIIKIEHKPLFPGYVFIESEISCKEILESLSTVIYASHDIVRLLKYSDTEIALRESERQKLLCLSNDRYCIESSRGIIIGDRIFITDGPLRGRENIVKRVNRHRREAWIELELMGSIRNTTVALEIVKRI